MNDTRTMLEIVRREQMRLRKRLETLDEREKIILRWIEKDQPEGPTEGMVQVAEDMLAHAKMRGPGHAR